MSSLINKHLSNEDVEYFVKNFALLYADDTVVLAETPKELQHALDAVYQYCNDWKLTVNTSKTKIIVFSKGRIRRAPAFTFGSNNIEVVSEYVYLGMLFSSNNSMKPAVLRQLNQPSKLSIV